MNKKESNKSMVRSRIRSRFKFSKIVLYVVLSMFVLMFSCSVSFAETYVNVIVDGKLLNPEVPARIDNNRTIIPFRDIFISLGFEEPIWDESTKTIIAIKDNTIIKLKINSYNANVNGKDVVLEVSPKIIEGRTMIPLYFINEIGIKPNWDKNTKTVTIDSNENENIVYNIPNESQGKIISELLSALNCNKVEGNQLTFLFLGDYNNANKIKWNELSDNEKLQCAKMKLSKLKGNKSPLCKDLKENQEVIFILSEYGTTGAEINRFNLIW